jgi:beta-N-acetylhexosaminidase
MSSSVNAMHGLGPILVGLPGTDLDYAARALLGHPAVGGVVLFTRNFAGREQLLQLVEDIRALRDPRLLVCIDQEGGRVQRLRDGFTRLPPLRALGRLCGEDPRKALDFAYRHGRVMATEMLACGIDLSFAPVLDLDRGSRVIGDRAFSDRPEVVEELGRAYLGGMHDAGMKTTGKHFPGHGSVAPDSHVDDVIDGRSLEQIEHSDLLPFQRLSGQLDALMIAHVVYPAVDALPAGYSSVWLRAILRNRIGFRGVVFSDDLGMHAARAVGDLRARRNSAWTRLRPGAGLSADDAQLCSAGRRVRQTRASRGAWAMPRRSSGGFTAAPPSMRRIWTGSSTRASANGNTGRKASKYWENGHGCDKPRPGARRPLRGGGERCSPELRPRPSLTRRLCSNARHWWHHREEVQAPRAWPRRQRLITATAPSSCWWY